MHVDDAHRRGFRTDAAEGDAMPTICDVMNAVEAQDVRSDERRRAKMPGLQRMWLGVLGEGYRHGRSASDSRCASATDGFGTLSGWRHDVADESCTVSLLSRHRPVVAERVSTSRLTRIIDTRCGHPTRVGQAAARRENFDRAGSSRHRRFLSAVRVLSTGCCSVAQRRDGVM